MVPHINVAQCPGTENNQHILRLRWEVGPSWRDGVFGGPLRANRRFLGRQQSLVSQERRQRNPAQASAAKPQKVPPVQQPAPGMGQWWTWSHKQFLPQSWGLALGSEFFDRIHMINGIT